jgi:starvation-inducible DNA-binding protein
MSQLNNIGIESDKADALAEKLNDLLANYQVFYMNVRGFHWNIKGEKFFELHVKFEELYDDLIMKIDEIAERILTLGKMPLHSYRNYLEVSEIKEAVNVTDGNECVEEILKGFSVLIAKQRELLELSGDAGDEGTNSMASDYIREQEKLVWMYTAFLNH